MLSDSPRCYAPCHEGIGSSVFPPGNPAKDAVTRPLILRWSIRTYSIPGLPSCVPVRLGPERLAELLALRRDAFDHASGASQPPPPRRLHRLYDDLRHGGGLCPPTTTGPADHPPRALDRLLYFITKTVVKTTRSIFRILRALSGRDPATLARTRPGRRRPVRAPARTPGLTRLTWHLLLGTHHLYAVRHRGEKGQSYSDPCRRVRSRPPRKGSQGRLSFLSAALGRADNLAPDWRHRVFAAAGRGC